MLPDAHVPAVPERHVPGCVAAEVERVRGVELLDVAVAGGDRDDHLLPLLHHDVPESDVLHRHSRGRADRHDREVPEQLLHRAADLRRLLAQALPAFAVAQDGDHAERDHRRRRLVPGLEELPGQADDLVLGQLPLVDEVAEDVVARRRPLLRDDLTAVVVEVDECGALFPDVDAWIGENCARPLEPLSVLVRNPE
jgi:hypothetical protein